MPIQHVPPPHGVKAPPLSLAARTATISGIPSFDENGQLPDTFETQFRNVVVNIKRVLDEAEPGESPALAFSTPQETIFFNSVWLSFT